MSVESQVRASELPNGIRVVTEEIPHSRCMSIGLLVDASPQHDPSGKEGLAHLCEHALFLGTRNRSMADISRTIDEVGGQMNAFTGRDYTCVYANIISDYCPLAMDLLSDLFQNASFPSEQLDRQKKTIAHEIGLAADDPLDLAHSILRENTWRSHPLGRPILGTIDSVEGLSRDDVDQFIQKNYTPNRIVVSAAGGLSHDAFVSQCRDAFWQLSGNRAATESDACQFNPSVSIIPGSSSQAYFVLGIPALPFAHDNRYAVHALNTMLGSGLSSRLFRKIRDSAGLVYHVQSNYHAYRDAGILCVEGVTSPDNLLDAIQMIATEIDDIAQAGLDEEALWRAQMQLRGQLVLSSDSTHTRMSRLATQELYFGRHVSMDEVLGGIDQLSQPFAQNVATEMFQAPRSCVVVGPTELHSSRERLEDIVTQGSTVLN